jgi:hypothetical protein
VGAELLRTVVVSSVGIAEGANEVDSVGTYHVGKMGDGEIADLTADGERAPEVAVPNTYETVAEAAAPMPARLTSLFGLPSFSTKSVDWTTGAPETPVDWAAILRQ